MLELNISRYCVPAVRLLLNVIVRMFPFTDAFKGMYCPVFRFLTPIADVPSFIGSLKVTLIVLLTGTFTALFVGSTLVTVGALLSAVLSALNELAVAVKLAVLLVVIFELVVFEVSDVADTPFKLSDAILKKISTAKNIFLVILPPPDLKTMSTGFHNLIS